MNAKPYDYATAARFVVKRNWSGPGFVLMDGLSVIAKRDTKRAAVQARLAYIAEANRGAA